MAMHPNSLANLKPARRGEVRNPRRINEGSSRAGYCSGELRREVEARLSQLASVALETVADAV